MTFEVIPAIDVSGGRIARFGASGPEPIAAFGGDPRKAAAAFAEAGSGWIHVVDMDLALTGRAHLEDLIRDIAAMGVRVQASGGITSGQQVEAVLSAGAARAVLSSAALTDRDATERLLSVAGERLVVGIEAEGPTITPRAMGARDLPLWDTLRWLSALPVPRYLFTEVVRVGGLGGPDLDGIWALATHTGRPVLASGGIRHIEDLKALAALGGGIEGAVVGRALHDGALDLAEALAAFG